MILALGFAAAGFILGVVLTASCAFYVFGLVHADLARQIEGYSATFLFSSGGAVRRPEDFNQGRLS